MVSFFITYHSCLTIYCRSQAAHATLSQPGGRARRIWDEPASPISHQPPPTPQASHRQSTSAPTFSAHSTDRTHPPTTVNLTSPAAQAALIPVASMQSPQVTPARRRAERLHHRRRRRGRTYVVFEGLEPGLYDSW